LAVQPSSLPSKSNCFNNFLNRAIWLLCGAEDPVWGGSQRQSWGQSLQRLVAQHGVTSNSVQRQRPAQAGGNGLPTPNVEAMRPRIGARQFVEDEFDVS
jgi:hypothetical protein